MFSPARLRHYLPHAGLLLILLLGAALRLWRLEQNGFGVEYYGAAVLSMSTSWHNFFYNAFDPAGYVSIDKPPVAFWIQALSVKLFGFDELAVLAPQAVEGLLSIVLLFWLVSRRFGRIAGLLAALFLAISPIAVAVDRSNNTESCLTLFLLLAASAATLAAERASLAWLAVAFALVGVAFNIKMLVAFGIVPALGAVYFLLAPTSWPRRIGHLAIAGVALLLVSLSWAAIYDLTPASQRPYAGSSANNSMLALAVEHNAMDRFVRPAGLTPRVPMQRAQQQAQRPDAQLATARTMAFDNVPIGPLRLADFHLARQIGWLFPLAAFGLLALCLRGGGAANREYRIAVVLWSLWALAYGVVFSFAGGIFHAYYLAVLTPPLAALAGGGVVALWQLLAARGWRATLLPLALVLCAAWQLWYGGVLLRWPETLFSQPEAWLGTLSDAVESWRGWSMAGALTALLAGLVIGISRLWRSLHAGTVTVAIVAVAGLCVLPATFAAGCAVVPGNPMPAARLATLGDPARADQAPPIHSGRIPFDPKLFEFLAANRGHAKYLLAVPNARLAAPIIIRTGQSVMAIGGFFGSDPIIEPDDLGRRAAAGELRYFLVLGPGAFGMGREMEGRRQAFISWAMRNGKLVDTTLWQSETDTWLRRAWLFDLSPQRLGAAGKN